LTLLPMKQKLLGDLGVDHLFAPEFNQKFSRISGEEFVERILVKQLKVSHVVVGENFSFGHKRSGTVETLRTFGKFKVTALPLAASAEGQFYSSSIVRDFLRQGKFQEAEKILGWAFEMEAPVIHGDARGRTLGFPTANQNVLKYVRIPYGVYAVKVRVEGEAQWRFGAANFGIRPMFEVRQPVLETFIFDFSDDIYDKNLRVQPVRYLRPEMSFQGVEALVAQMKEDCIRARACLHSSDEIAI
jgi:riboflavin kinase/FMN adenylyltransferase